MLSYKSSIMMKFNDNSRKSVFLCAMLSHHKDGRKHNPPKGCPYCSGELSLDEDLKNFIKFLDKTSTIELEEKTLDKETKDKETEDKEHVDKEHVDVNDEVGRLFNCGKSIFKTSLIGGGWIYTLTGEICGMETFGLDTYQTSIYKEPFQAEHEFHSNGVIMRMNGVIRKSSGSFGCGLFSGMDQPFSLWNSVTIKGVDNKDVFTELTKDFEKHGVKYSLILDNEVKEKPCKFTLTLDSPGYRFFATPAPYTNGVDFSVLEADDLPHGKKIHSFRH